MTTERVRTRPAEPGAQWLRPALLLVIIAGLGVVMAVVVDSPNKRLIEAVGGGLFLMVALMVHISFSLGVLLAMLPFPAGTYYGTSNEILILVLLTVYAVKQMVRREPVFRATPIDLPVALLVVATLLSLFHEDSTFDQTVPEVRAFFSAIALYYMIVAGCSESRHVKRLMTGYLIAMTAASLVAVLQMFLPGTTLIPKFIYVKEEEEFIHYVRAAGTFENFSVFGQYMALNMILTSYLFIRSRSIHGKVLYVGLLALACGTFLSSAMRGALFTMAAGLIYLAVMGRHQVKLREWATMLVMIVVLLVFLTGVMLAYLGTGYLFERFRGFSLEYGSPTSRKDMNLYFLREALDYPFVGHGPHINVEVGIGGARSVNPHCQYIRYFYTIGLIGLAGFVWAMVNLFRYSLRAVRSRAGPDPWSQAMVVVFHTMFVVFALHELVDDYMQVRLYQHIVWSIFGILVVLSRLVLEDESSPSGAQGVSLLREGAAPGIVKGFPPTRRRV